MYMGNDQFMPYMQMMNIPNQYAPMMTMPEENLENMYPKIYYIINPACDIECENLCMKKGDMYTPTQEELEAMTNKVYNQVESEVEAEIAKMEKNDKRQFGFGGRRLLRDLISILLIRRLLRRRRPFFPGFFGPPFGGFRPYDPGFGGFPY